MTIGRAAEAAGVSVETIRFYERKGLIAQPRIAAGSSFRIYPETTVRRVRFIRQAQRLGFTLNEAGELLSLQEDTDADCAIVFDRAQTKLLDIRKRIAQLQDIETALDALARTCPGSGATDDCPIIEALICNPDKEEVENASLAKN